MKDIYQRCEEMMESVAREILDACADRLEKRAEEFRAAASNHPDEDYYTVATVLINEAKVVRAGLHKFKEKPAFPTSIQVLAVPDELVSSVIYVMRKGVATFPKADRGYQVPYQVELGALNLLSDWCIEQEAYLKRKS